MWWSRRSAIATTVALALAACGFAPAYGPGGPAGALQGQVAVQAPGTLSAYVLVARLEERLGRPGSTPGFALSYTLSTGQDAVAITPAAEITRYNVTGTLDWRLTDTATGTIAASGQTTAFTSYSATGSTIATRAAREDATDRLMTILADRTVDEIILKTAGRGP
jgi:LPS-assembly lipoprotein